MRRTKLRNFRNLKTSTKKNETAKIFIFSSVTTFFVRGIIFYDKLPYFRVQHRHSKKGRKLGIHCIFYFWGDFLCDHLIFFTYFTPPPPPTTTPFIFLSPVDQINSSVNQANKFLKESR